MGSYIINGGAALKGSVTVQGSKNSSVAVLIASLITDGITILRDIPDISDVNDCIAILCSLGCTVEKIDKNVLKINTSGIGDGKIPVELTRKMRASSYLIGAMLSRFGKCESIISGGCDFGSRPLDLHILAMQALGAVCLTTESGQTLSAPHSLRGGEIVFPIKTVGATINSMIAAAKAAGTTVIKGAAREPHIRDVADYLNLCGADIRGAGSDTIIVHGVSKLHGCDFTVCPDMIEAGTFITYSLLTGGDITCLNAPVNQLSSFLNVIDQMGAKLITKENSVKVTSSSLSPACVHTAPYPGFPTDLHPQTAVLMASANGISTICETVFKNRFHYLEPLRALGLTATESGCRLTIYGNTSFTGGEVRATDLRGGAALVGAALCAHGKSVINDTVYIERGYSEFVGKLRTLGAEITERE